MTSREVLNAALAVRPTGHWFANAGCSGPWWVHGEGRAVVSLVGPCVARGEVPPTWAPIAPRGVPGRLAPRGMIRGECADALRSGRPALVEVGGDLFEVEVPADLL